MINENLNGQESVATSAVETIDFTEFVKELGREYGEGIYESEGIETPEDLQCQIDWADVNFYEGDSLSWMLEDCDSPEIAALFNDMEWEEYREYEHIFVEAAKEKMEECLGEWRNNLAADIVSDCEANIATDTDNFFDSVKCYGIESYDQIDQIENLETKQYVLERVKEVMEWTKWEIDNMYEKIGNLYGCSCVGPDDGFAVNLPIMKFFGFNESEYGYNNMSNCIDYMEDKYEEVWGRLDEVEYQIESKQRATISA